MGLYDALTDGQTQATASPGTGPGMIDPVQPIKKTFHRRVRDTGPGMDARTLDSAFTPFFSAQRAGRRRGLGLPRAKRYVENNGGRIWIRTRPGEGTTVYVQLPRLRG